MPSRLTSTMILCCLPCFFDGQDLLGGPARLPRVHDDAVADDINALVIGPPMLLFLWRVASYLLVESKQVVKY